MRIETDHRRAGFLLGCLMLSAGAWAQIAGQNPRIGYLYPAGAQQGSTVEVMVGGQFLRGASNIHVVGGGGVRGTVTEYIRPLNNDTLKAIAQRLQALRKVKGPRLKKAAPEAAPAGAPEEPQPAPDKPETVPLPNHPMLRDLENLSPPELQYVADYFAQTRRQKNAQIGEIALVEITVAADATPGARELRLSTPAGLSNPMRFEVGTLPETMEREPNEPPAAARPGALPGLSTPFVLNGQILPGDVDRFRFQGRKGQTLVIQAAARALNPYLADAVPGWFQAALALYGPDGRELAYQDDYRFSPDPVLCFAVPEDGEYAVEMYDALYRGREDFVYRIAIGEQPYITELFPLGAQAGATASVTVNGWNLPQPTLALDTEAGKAAIREAHVESAGAISNAVAYAVDDLASDVEHEPNETPEQAGRVTAPALVDGRIDFPGDVDIFAIEGRTGEDVVAEIQARRLQSPMDSVVYILDTAGNTLGWNDDMETANAGLLTHHADSCLRARFPADGTYYVKVVDAQRNGGPAYAYRLRIGPPQPDFELYVTPSTLNFRAGSRVPITLHAVRKDGFDGAIDIALVEPADSFVLEGGHIPAGRDQIRLTIAAPRQLEENPVPIRLAGRAEIGGQEVRHRVQPAEDLMQAFFYRHLVPARQLVASVTAGRRSTPPVSVIPTGTISVPAGGTAEVRIQTAAGPLLEKIHLTLSDPPAGLSLAEVRPEADGMTLILSADGNVLEPGYTDNLIVAADVAAEDAPGRGAGTKKKGRVALGVLPAIPIEVVAQ